MLAQFTNLKNKNMKDREFLENQLNTEKLTPLQQQGIEIAMRKYAEYYHKEELSKSSQLDVIKNEVVVCEHDWISVNEFGSKRCVKCNGMYI